MLPLIRQIKEAKISLWVDDNNLELCYQDDSAMELILNVIKPNKENLLHFLKENNVFSQIDFDRKTIFKCTSEFSPLSFIQESLLFIEKMENGTNAYHIPHVVKLRHGANLDLLLSSVNLIAERHQILKSVYEEHPELGEVQRYVPGTIPLYSATIDASADLDIIIRGDISQPFDLTQTYPFRLHHYIQGEQKYLLFLWHHIAFDGWSTEIFLDELSCAYSALSKQQQPQWPPLSIQYADFAQWQRDYLTGDNITSLSSYWSDHLKGYQNLSLPTDKPRPTQVRYDGDEYAFVLGAALSDQLRELARSEETTLYTVMLSAFYVTLATLSGQKDIVIGTPSDNRHNEQTHSIIGLFANTIAIRNHVTPTLTVQRFVRQVQQTVLGGKQHQDMPFDRIVNELAVERDLSRHPIFQVMFMLQSFGRASQALPFEPLSAQGANAFYTAAKFDLTLAIDDAKSNLSGVLNFSTHLFEKSTIERFASMYLQVLKGFVANPQQSLAELPCMSPQDEHTLLVEWNQTQCEFPKHLTLHRCFEQQVERTPDATALIFQHQELSYQELNHRANQLAYAIRENYQHMHGRPLEPDTPVMLYLERSLEMVVAILAVLKAGAAYVPVAPEFPQARTLFMVQDTQTSIVLTQQALTTKLEEWTSALDTPPSVLAIDDAAAFAQHPTSNLPEHSSPSDLAYILYTSGTTGQPKGVMLQHDGVVNRIHWMQKQYPLTQADRVLQKTPYVFDVSVWELLWANWVGAAIVMAEPDSHKDPQQLCQAIVQHQVTTLHFVPSMLQVFGQFLAEQDRSLPASVRWVFASGEALSATHCDLFKQVRHPQAQLHNLYGPTEASIDVTYYDCQKLKGTSVPIGQPIDNIQLYVLSEQGKPVPVGAPGELYLGGVGVARGYLHREKLTQERFVPNPFDTDGQAPRLYKTGDLVRWLPDGHLEYLGRNDFQVKIRGLRIELGEIEQRLSGLEDVKHAVVTVTEVQEQPALSAYIVTHSKNELDEKAVASTLSQHLPSYMLPVSYTYLDKLPVTINGKLDRNALPAPNIHSTREYVAPSSPLERTLCEIWQEVLGVEQVSVEDNFFRLGGNSISTVRVSSLLQQRLGTEVPLSLIFTESTIKALAQSLVSPNIESLHIAPSLNANNNQCIVEI